MVNLHTTQGLSLRVQPSFIIRQAWVLKLVHIYRVWITSYIFNIRKHEKCPTFRSSCYMSYSAHSPDTINAHDISLPYSKADANQMRYRNKFIEVLLDILTFIKRKQSHSAFENALTMSYLSQHWYKRQSQNIFQCIYLSTKKIPMPCVIRIHRFYFLFLFVY